MFDNSFERSELYFTVIQLLRIIRQWAEESMADHIALQQEWLQARSHLGFNFTDNELRNIERNWDTILFQVDIRTKRLFNRIDQKTEEVKSLRDGLFNATSLREAGKGMALNRAIYVFTVVTVIYTPLGFMATFWALPVMNSSNGSNDGNGLSLTALISTFVVIPLLTYIISLFTIGYFTIESSRRALNSESFQWLLDQITNFPGKIKKGIRDGFHYLRRKQFEMKGTIRYWMSERAHTVR